MGIDEKQKISGESVIKMFPGDHQAVDEWMEYFVKTRFDLTASIASNAKAVETKVTLQYFNRQKQWAAVYMTADIEKNKMSVEFAQPDTAENRIGLDHVIELKQHEWLENYIADEGKWEIDIDTQTIYMSRVIAQALKFSEEAVIVSIRKFLSFIHPDDRQEVISAVRNVSTSQKIIYTRFLLEDGSIAYFNSFGIPAYNDDGKMTRIIGRSQNITDKETAMEKLAVSEQRFRGIVENSQDLFITINTKGVVTYVSPNIQKLVGYTGEQAIGRPFSDFVAYPEEEKELWSALDDVLSGGKFEQSNYRIRCADGSVIWFSIYTSAICDMKGKVTEVVAVCRDVTEDMDREESLRYMSQHDALTGMYNRFYFEEELERVQKEGITGFGLLITDLNGLKLINDAFGHQKGDELLIETANLLSGLARGHAVCRTGGDEFAILIHDTSLPELEKLCEKIEEASKRTISRTIPLSISWGTALRSSQSQNVHVLFKEAEGRMYNNKLLDSRSMHSQVIASLKETLKARNVETADHMQRMEKMVTVIGKQLGLPSSEFDRLVLLASMHDIGKVAIPDHIISKPGSLTEDEWEVMRTHSEIGCRIALTSQELSGIANEICCHHERWDGSGYPYGYKLGRTPLLSRIISVVDTYDVMTHKRVYKDAVGHKEAIEELKKYAGTQFDPQIVDHFIRIFGSLSEKEMQNFIGGGITLDREPRPNSLDDRGPLDDKLA